MKKVLLSTFIILILWGNVQASEMLEPSLNTQLEKGYKVHKKEMIKEQYKIYTLFKRNEEEIGEYIFCKVDLLRPETLCWRP